MRTHRLSMQELTLKARAQDGLDPERIMKAP